MKLYIVFAMVTGGNAVQLVHASDQSQIILSIIGVISGLITTSLCHKNDI